LQKQISHYDESALCRLLLEISLLESAYKTCGEGNVDILLSTAKRYHIDPKKLQKAVANEFAAKQQKEKKKEQKIAPNKGTP
jgi:hypothetical protein